MLGSTPKATHVVVDKPQSLASWVFPQGCLKTWQKAFHRASDEREKKENPKGRYFSYNLISKVRCSHSCRIIFIKSEPIIPFQEHWEGVHRA